MEVLYKELSKKYRVSVDTIKSIQTELQNLEKLRALPTIEETEKTVIGSLITSKETYYKCEVKLKEELFTDAKLISIFRAYIAMLAVAATPDPITLAAKLIADPAFEQMTEKQIQTYLYSLMMQVPGSGSQNITERAQSLVKYYLNRQLIMKSNQAISSAYNNDEPTVTIMSFITLEDEIRNFTTTSSIKPIKMVGDQVIKDIEAKIKAYKEDDGAYLSMIGVPTPFQELNKLTNGWQNGEFIVLGARPGMGKTTWLINCAEYGAKFFNKKTAIISLEVSSTSLYYKFISKNTNYSIKQLQAAYQIANMQPIYESKAWIDKIPIYFDDPSSIDVLSLRALIRKFKREYEIEVVYIDYLQLISAGEVYERSGGNTSDAAISFISRTLMHTAKELKIPIIALSQLNRDATKTADKRPKLQHIRGSGSIEQDAHVILFLHSEEYYAGNDPSFDPSLRNISEIIVAKNRDGGGNQNINVNYFRDRNLWCDILDDHHGINTATNNNNNYNNQQKYEDDWK